VHISHLQRLQWGNFSKNGYAMVEKCTAMETVMHLCHFGEIKYRTLECRVKKKCQLIMSASIHSLKWEREREKCYCAFEMSKQIFIFIANLHFNWVSIWMEALTSAWNYLIFALMSMKEKKFHLQCKPKSSLPSNLINLNSWKYVLRFPFFLYHVMSCERARDRERKMHH
jgi:hypothetical protein